jgi:hypothetical protein
LKRLEEAQDKVEAGIPHDVSKLAIGEELNQGSEEKQKAKEKAEADAV